MICITSWQYRFHLWESYIFPYDFVLSFRILLFQLAGFSLGVEECVRVAGPMVRNFLGVFIRKSSFLHSWRTVLPDIVFGMDSFHSFSSLNIVSHSSFCKDAAEKPTDTLLYMTNCLKHFFFFCCFQDSLFVWFLILWS